MRGAQLVLLPGLDGTGGLFAPFLRAWKCQPQPLVIDYPRDRFLDYAQALDHACTRMPASGPLVVVAESFSGPVGIALAARQPERVRALVLCATFASPPRTGLLRHLLRVCAPLIFRAPAPAFLVREVLLNGCDDARLLALVCENKRTVRPDVMTRRLRMVLSCDAGDDLQQVRCPILYLQATRDRLVPPSAAEEIRAIQPPTKIMPVECPHFVLQSAPEESASAIEKFMQGHGHEPALPLADGRSFL